MSRHVMQRLARFGWLAYSNRLASFMPSSFSRQPNRFMGGFVRQFSTVKKNEYENERQYETLKVEKFAPLKAHETVESILYLYEREKYTNGRVPMTLSVEDMRHLISLHPNEKELLRALKYFYKRETSRYADSRKKAAKKAEIARMKREKYGPAFDESTNGKIGWNHGIWDDNEENLVYGLWHNSLLSRITRQAVRDYRQVHLLRQAAQFGQKLLVDLAYDGYMAQYEARLLASQIGVLYYENRLNSAHPEALPFDIHFTNCASSTLTLPALGKQIKRIEQLGPYFHSGSYLDRPDLFPRESLVYLSPHASEPLRTYDHDAVYILGGYNDRTTHHRVSHVKAQSEGVTCRRLPLDENVLWKQGNKNLTLNQVAAILHSVKATNGDWANAIRRFAPQRKIKSQGEVELEDEIRVKQIARRLKSIERSYRIDR